MENAAEDHMFLYTNTFTPYLRRTGELRAPRYLQAKMQLIVAHDGIELPGVNALHKHVSTTTIKVYWHTPELCRHTEPCTSTNQHSRCQYTPLCASTPLSVPAHP